MLSDNSTVGEARQSQTFGILNQAQLVDKVFFVDSTDLYKITDSDLISRSIRSQGRREPI